MVDEVHARITLVDFETATVVPAFAELPGVPGELEGTLAYMAPEQSGRTKRLVDRRADLYALGATFYEMLTGQLPFPATDPLELLQAHAARAPYPPAIINAAVPTVVSDMVMKLLAKMPEWRYQTAAALAADLVEARRRYRERNEIAPFALGRAEVPYGFVITSEKLYGRDHEARLLADAIERVGTGRTEVVIVAGPAGIGKSALVGGSRELALERGRWLTGRGDLLRGNVPYAPIIEAFSALVRDLAGEPDVTALRERIVQATSPNAAVLVDAMPDLRALIGDQPPVPKVGTIESEHRFLLVFAAFVRALVAEQRSVVLFIDDLQWLDPGSLKLLRTIAADPDVRSLLMFCASRTEDPDSEHPVTRFLDSIQQAGARVTRVELGQLDANSLVALLCDALHAQPADVVDLAGTIQRKTGSNPFFVRQFLGYLYREQLLVFDTHHNRWAWNLARIELADVTPNIVDLLAKAIETLPPEARRALRAAACVGNRFEIGLLAHVLDQTLDDTARALWVPLQHGLIVPVAEGPRFSWIVDKPVELADGSKPHVPVRARPHPGSRLPWAPGGRPPDVAWSHRALARAEHTPPTFRGRRGGDRRSIQPSRG